MSRDALRDWDDPAAEPSGDPEWFLDLVEGTLPPAEERDRRRELRRDPELQRRFDSYQAKVTLLQELGKTDTKAEASPVLRARILAAVAAESGPAPARRRPLPWLALLASGTLAAAAALFFAVQLKDPGPGPTHGDVAQSESERDVRFARKGEEPEGEPAWNRDADAKQPRTLEAHRFGQQLEAAKAPADENEPRGKAAEPPAGDDVAKLDDSARQGLAKDGRPDEGKQRRTPPVHEQADAGGEKAVLNDVERSEPAGGAGRGRDAEVARESLLPGQAAAGTPADQATILVVDVGESRQELTGLLADLQTSARAVAGDELRQMFVAGGRAQDPQARLLRDSAAFHLDASRTNELVQVRGSQVRVAAVLRQVMLRFDAQASEVPRSLFAATPAADPRGQTDGPPRTEPRPSGPTSPGPLPTAPVTRPAAKSEAKTGVEADRLGVLDTILDKAARVAPHTAAKKEDDALEVWLLVRSGARPDTPAESKPKR